MAKPGLHHEDQRAGDDHPQRVHIHLHGVDVRLGRDIGLPPGQARRCLGARLFFTTLATSFSVPWLRSSF
jgi:hypothetical protein